MSSQNILNEYLKQVDSDWTGLLTDCYALISDWCPDLELKIWKSMGFSILGWGQTNYILSNNKVNQWFIIGLAAQKQYCSLYIWGIEDNQYLIEKYKNSLGKIKSGKSCINLKSLDEINLCQLKKIVDLAVKYAQT